MAKNGCSDCFYRIKIGNRFCCGYFLITNEVRPSASGNVCSVKILKAVGDGESKPF